jgi:hypothetical protein
MFCHFPVFLSTSSVLIFTVYFLWQSTVVACAKAHSRFFICNILFVWITLLEQVTQLHAKCGESQLDFEMTDDCWIPSDNTWFCYICTWFCLVPIPSLVMESMIVVCRTFWKCAWSCLLMPFQISLAIDCLFQLLVKECACKSSL